LYKDDFFKKHQSGSKKSAREIVPLIIELINPKSVVDVGCGVGEWLATFKENGIEDIIGIDGPWVNKQLLKIPQNQFIQTDLTQPIFLKRKFDLVTSLEVAEHLPKECAPTFIHALTNLGSTVMFSAAIPLQRGTHHVNEQWPDYWKKLFEAEDYTTIDAIRRQVWQNPNVEAWYAQNILIYVNQNELEIYPKLKAAQKDTRQDQLSIVHPRIFIERACPTNKKIMDLTKIARQKLTHPTLKSKQ
jgi:cyclopropane fatty-acyl-phospholipid synthase-like methyltransferase